MHGNGKTDARETSVPFSQGSRDRDSKMALTCVTKRLRHGTEETLFHVNKLILIIILVKCYYYFISLRRKVNFNIMVNKDTIFILVALALLATSLTYSAIKVRKLKKSAQSGTDIRGKVVKVKKAGERPAPKDYDPTDEESGFAPVEVSEEEFEQEPRSALEEYLDPSTPESRRSALAKDLQDAGYDIR